MNRFAARVLQASLLALGISAASAQSFPEKQTVHTAPPAGPTRAYVSDIAIQHIVDGRLHVVDVDAARYVGQIPLGYAGQAVLSPDRKRIYVSTTYYPRLWRGTRADVIDIWDAETLSFIGEIPIPERRAQALNYKGMISVSPDSRWLYVQNATPASSISIVDLRERKLASEVANSGCWLALPVPSAPNRFATLCGDGTMETITLDERGALASRERSERFFDADVDPVFVHAETVGDRFFFVSFLGKVYEVDLSAEKPRAIGSWSLIGTADAKKAWRPGGYQLFAVHAKSGRMYVLMHPDGQEGSHKNPAAEIWAFDLATKKRIARIPGNNAISVTAIQKGAPRLVALDAMTMGLVLIDAGDKPRVVQRMDGVAEAGTLIEMQ
ncbi:MAG: amine dehydrogenase large subunit [Burkholderiaceae bacterium]|jgi:methylamine dehydrogenase heavy chain|nr:amine dehydrogenase large subunit [Burkholderiaceae bacterium]